MLRLSKKADYALMALQYITSVQYGDMPERIVNTKEISEEYSIPTELLAKVLQTLAKHGIIESQNGPKGGYTLARPAADITIARVLEAIEGPIGITDCYHDSRSLCVQQEHCNIRTPLLKVQESIYQLLNSMTIKDMMGDAAPLITVQSLSTEGADR